MCALAAAREGEDWEDQDSRRVSINVRPSADLALLLLPSLCATPIQPALASAPLCQGMRPLLRPEVLAKVEEDYRGTWVAVEGLKSVLREMPNHDLTLLVSGCTARVACGGLQGPATGCLEEAATKRSEAESARRVGTYLPIPTGAACSTPRLDPLQDEVEPVMYMATKLPKLDVQRLPDPSNAA